MKLDGFGEEAVGSRKRGAAYLVRKVANSAGDLRLQRLRATAGKPPDEFGKLSAGGCAAPRLGRGGTRKGDIPGPVEGQVPGQHGDAEQRRSVLGHESQEPDLGVKRAVARRGDGVHAGFKHRVQLAPRSWNGDPRAIHEDVNAIASLTQCLKQKERVREQLLDSLVRSGENAQRQREHCLEVECVCGQQREVQIVSGRRAEQFERYGPGVRREHQAESPLCRSSRSWRTRCQRKSIRPTPTAPFQSSSRPVLTKRARFPFSCCSRFAIRARRL